MIWLIILIVLGIIITSLIVIIPIPVPSEDKPVSKPKITYNDDWLFTVHNENSSSMKLHFLIMDTDQICYEVEKDIESSTYVELTPYIDAITPLQNNFNYLSRCWFVSHETEVETLPFRTPGYDAFAEVLKTNPDTSYLMNYFRANIGEWVHVTDTDYWTFPSKFWNTFVRGNPSFENMSGSFSQQAFYFNTGGIALENGNAPYGFNFRANRNMDKVSFQLVWLPLEHLEITPDLVYINMELVHPMTEGETYYFIQKGAAYVPFSFENYHFPVFWPYPDAVPFGGNDDVSIKATTDSVNSRYPVNTDIPFDDETGIFGCYQFLMTGQQFWYPYTNT